MSSNPQQDTAGEQGHTVQEALAAIDGAASVSFELGELVVTPGAQRAVVELGINPAQLFDRHRAGDWGDVSEGDRIANENALKTGARIWSVYKFESLEDGRLWVITDGDDDDGVRHATTILLPSEY